jgi:hypothetical protein
MRLNRSRALLISMAALSLQLSLLAAAPPEAAGAGVAIPRRIDLGAIGARAKVDFAIDIANGGELIVSANAVSLCPCVEFLDKSVFIKPKGKARLRARFDPSGLSGKVERGILVFTTDRSGTGAERRYVALEASLPVIAGAAPCLGCDEVNERIKTESAERSVGAAVLEFFGDPSCAACEEFLGKGLPALERKLGRKIPLVLHSAYDAAALDYLTQELAKRGAAIEAFPIIIAGEKAFQGEAALKAKDGRLAAALAKPDAGR